MAICIDPGHGGSDPGATHGNTYEKTITLAIAKKLNTLLKAQGFKTLMTRTGDVEVKLAKRCEIANNANAELFVSVHVNSNSGTPATGIETLIYATGGNAEKCAKKVQSALISATKATDRKVKTAPTLYVLKNTKMPAILVETGFINNSSDRAKLTTDAYQNTLATAIAKGICAYYGKEYKVSNTTKTKFSDTKGHCAEAAINEMAELGIVTGYGNGKFGPNDNLTRGQAAIIAKRIIDHIKKG